ncbi:MAG: glycoside hydrolase family 16 protein [Bacteroidales bacterium]
MKKFLSSLLCVFLGSFLLAQNTSDITEQWVGGRGIPADDLKRLPSLTADTSLAWRLSWKDDFSFLDSSKWKVAHHHDHWGKGFVKLKQNVSITPQGYVKMDIKDEVYRCPETSYYCRAQQKSDEADFVYEHTAGEIYSKCKYQVKYGYLEARIKFPVVKGTWCSFWTYATDCVPLKPNEGEIDIVELWSSESLFLGRWNLFDDIFTTNLHLCYAHNDAKCDSSNQKKHHYPSETLQEWNIYGVYWNENEIRYYFNGNLLRTIPNHQIHSPVDIIFSAWATSKYATSSSSMYVDWIRVFQKESLLLDFAPDMQRIHSLKPVD